MPQDHEPGLYDLFVSYSTRDNAYPAGQSQGWVQAFIARIRVLAKEYTSQNLTTTEDVDAGFDADYTTFFDKDDIHAGHDWHTRLLTAVSHTRVLLACLSPRYWKSPWCRREWETYLANEAARGLANMLGGITPIYIAAEPGTDAKAILDTAPAWVKDILAARQVRLLPFETHGLDALARIQALSDDPATRVGLGQIAVRLGQQIKYARRAESFQQGNLATGTDTFVGRTEELAHVERQLFGGGALGVITALQGLGGQGKTALALRYGHNLRGRYTGGCWQVIAEGRHQLLPLLATLREPLKLPAIATDSESDTTERVLHELHRRAFDPAHRREQGEPAAVLLVIDNVDQPRILAQGQRDALRQAMGRAGITGDPGWLHLLATTRLEASELTFLPREKIIPVDALPLAEALRLWTDLLAEPGRDLGLGELEAATSIITLLERHTLAVEVAARHIRRTQGQGETSASYLKRLEMAIARGAGEVARHLANQQQPLQSTETLPGYTHALKATLQFTFDHLKEQHPAAATVLHFAAHFPAEAVPLPWLRILAGQHHPEVLEPAEAPDIPSAWDAAELRLSESLRLLTHAEGDAPEIARLHRLAGDFLRQGAKEAGEDEGRRAEVEGFIYQRMTRAEHVHHMGLQAWERVVLLADLPARVAREDCPVVIAQSLGVLIEVLRSFADLGTARRLALQQNAAFQRHVTFRPNDFGAQRGLSLSFIDLGDLAAAQGDLAGAVRSITESKSILERLVQSELANADWQYHLSASLIRLGELAVAQGDLAGAARYFTEARTIDERFANSALPGSEWQSKLSVTFDKLGELSLAGGDLAGAERYFSKSFAICERLAQSDPANARWQRTLSFSYNSLGELAVARGDLAGAERYLSKSFAIRKRIAQSDPANATWQYDLGMSKERLGDLAIAQGELERALVFYTERKDIMNRLAASDPASSAWQRGLAVSHFKINQLARKTGDEEMMRASLQECVTVLDAMKRQGMHLDPAAAQLHGQLAGTFGGVNAHDVQRTKPKKPWWRLW
jgi:tetratricopeptide (TPR) repeat protein